LDRDGTAAAYPLGFGLSYTSFRIGHVVQVYDSRPSPERSGSSSGSPGWAVDPGGYRIDVGGSAADPAAASLRVEIAGS
jgi:hypothetical protein